MQNNIEEWFADGLLVRKIPGFAYPERFCPFCERELDVWGAVHYGEEPLIYKALYVCHNDNCPAYKAEAEIQYVKVYYSSSEAFQLFDNFKLGFKQKRANPGLIQVTPDDIDWEKLGFDVE